MAKKEKKEIHTFEQLRRKCNLTDTFQPKIYHQNDFVLSKNSTGTSVIVDLSVKLMWSESFSNEIAASETGQYIAEINKSNFFGFNDWRLPTTKELLTLISSKNIDRFWSSDFYNDSDLFSVNFFTGSVSWSKYPCLVNPVRNYLWEK